MIAAYAFIAVERERIQVVPDASGEQHGVLWHYGDRSPQQLQPHLPDVAPVNYYRALTKLCQPKQGNNDAAFPGAV